MKIPDSKTILLMYTAILTVIQDKGRVQSSTGGPCISHAQRQCQDEGSNLWTATQENQVDTVCSFFLVYQRCIVSHMTQCDYKPHERELHQTDIVNHYVNPPYSCPFPEQHLETSMGRKSDRSTGNLKSDSANRTCYIFLLYVTLVLHVQLFYSLL